MFGIRTDLALEAHEMYQGQAEKKEELKGVKVENNEADGIKMTKVVISDTEGEKALGKPVGTYITLEAPDIMYSIDTYEKTCEKIAEQIRFLGDVKDNSVILVVGLGNESITPDALGPKTVSKLMVTRHLKQYVPQHISEDIRSVCALAPGVLGTTGIETAEIIKGTVERVKPDLIIAVDALASRSMDRISKTIQIADTGISPGAGVGNRRFGLDKESLGVKVIAVGVPTVVDAATVASDSIDMVLDKVSDGESGRICTEFDKMGTDKRHTLIKDTLSENIANLVVTPKDIDMIIEKVSKTVANGINLALHKDITLEEIASYVE